MKLYATTISDKGGREAKKGGDSYIRATFSRGNEKLGVLGLYEIENNGGYRLYWHPVKGKEIEIYNSDNEKRTA